MKRERYTGTIIALLAVIPNDLLSLGGGDKIDEFGRGGGPGGDPGGLAKGVVGIDQHFITPEQDLELGEIHGHVVEQHFATSKDGTVAATVTNAVGEYRFNGLQAGPVTIAFELEGACRGDAPKAGCSNRSAIGAQVALYWNGQEQVQEVSGGSGFCAQNERRLHFGLGAGAVVEKARVRWPSGKMDELVRPEANRVYKLKEPV